MRFVFFPHTNQNANSWKSKVSKCQQTLARCKPCLQILPRQPSPHPSIPAIVRAGVKKTYTRCGTNATKNQKFVPDNHARRQADDDCPFVVHARTSRTAPLLLFNNEPNLISIACATGEMTGRVSVLSYTVVFPAVVSA